MCVTRCLTHYIVPQWQHLFPGVPLIEGDTIIEQPVDLNTLTPRYNDKATAFVDRALDKKQPFFLYFAYDEAHIPLFASNKFMNTSRRGLYGDAVAGTLYLLYLSLLDSFCTIMKCIGNAIATSLSRFFSFFSFQFARSIFRGNPPHKDSTPY